MRLFTQFIICLVILFIAACGPPKNEPNELTIAVAASLTLPITEIVHMYKEKSGVQVAVVSGSSGKIAAQVAAGAPYDLFLSADFDYPAALLDQGFAQGDIKEFARGRLALFVRTDTPYFNLDYLLNDEIKTIAVPNPDVAPYGRASVQALQNAGIYEQVKAKLVYGESVGQVNQFLHSGVVDAGITAATFTGMKLANYSVVSVDTLLYLPILHGAVVLKNADSDAQLFLEFLLLDKGQNILRRYGL